MEISIEKSVKNTGKQGKYETKYVKSWKNEKNGKVYRKIGDKYENILRKQGDNMENIYENIMGNIWKICGKYIGENGEL